MSDPRCPILFVVVLAGSSPNPMRGDEGIGSEWVRAIRKGHPRLILPDDRVSEVRKSLKRDPVPAGWYGQVRASAERLLKAGPIEYERSDRGNMLGSCVQAVDRIYRLGLVYRLEGDKRFARCAAEELMHAAGLPDWNPAHFLDTAELTHAVAIGYDWFFDELTPTQRGTLRRALRDKGLKAAFPFYETSLPVVVRYMYFNWAVCNHNWNPVCNGGMTIGALAIAEDEPQLAGQVLSWAHRSIQRAMREFEPDGGWAEGPGYWRYATSYTVYFLAALETAVGPQAIEPFLDMPGFRKTGEFGIHMVGPTNRSFNFADASDHVGRVPHLFWLAAKFKQPLYAWQASRLSGACPEGIIWFSPEQKTPERAGLPLDACFPHVGVMFFRGDWEDRNAVYVGFKGGYNGANHSHLDLGTFVLDADGYRWAVDLGSDRYSLPGYFDKGKLTYYRLTSAGHNVPMIEGKPQSPTARADVIAFHSRPGRAFGVVDLSEAYGRPPGRIRRGIQLIRRRYTLIQDELDLREAGELVWQMHTRADVHLGGSTATLSKDGKILTARILQPESAVFDVMPASPSPPESPNPDVRKLVVRLQIPLGETRLAVLLTPGKQKVVPEMRPLSRWGEESRSTSKPGVSFDSP